MNSILAKIYVLIMLECRVPLEEASKVFGIEKGKLFEEIRNKTSGIIYGRPLEYLEEECLNCPEEVARGKWKAQIYFRRLQRILKCQDKDEKVRLLNEFITAISGPDISFAINKRSYSEIEKETIMKFRLKYSISGRRMKSLYHIGSSTLKAWERDLPEGELKARCRVLTEYIKDKDATIKKTRHLNLARKANMEYN